MGHTRLRPVGDDWEAEYSELRETLRAAILDRRVELMMTQTTFAKLAGIPSTSLSNLECGTGRTFTVDRLVRVLLGSGLKRGDIARIIRG